MSISLPPSFSPYLPFPLTLESQSLSKIELSASCVPEISAKTVQLENGLKVYFVNRQDLNSNIAVASFRLIVHAGTLAEEESEWGLAHLLEHCVYLGTKSFSSEQIQDIQKSLGCQIGVHASATTFPRGIVFKFDGVPTKEKEKVETCLKLLYELAFCAVLPLELVAKERFIVLDEELKRAGSTLDLNIHQIRALFSENPYLEQLLQPVCKSVREASKEELQSKLMDFYQKLYFPPNMELVVAGDFGKAVDQESCLRFIQDHFAAAPRASVKPTWVQKSIQSRSGTDYNVFKSSQVNYTSIGIWRPRPCQKTKVFKRGSGLNSLVDLVENAFFAGIFSRRIHNAVNDEKSGIYRLSMSHPAEVFPGSVDYVHVQIIPKAEKVQAAYKQFLKALQTITFYGVHKKELELEISSYLSEIENQTVAVANRSHSVFIEGFVERLMKNKCVRDPQKKIEIIRELVQQLSLERINSVARQWWDIFSPTTQNPQWVVTLIAPEKQPSERILADMQEIFLNVCQNDKIKDNIEKESDQRWIPAMPEKAPLIECEELSSINCKKFSFGNGISVLLKSTEEIGTKIHLDFSHPTGLRNFLKEDQINLLLAIKVFNQCGLADRRAEEVSKTVFPALRFLEMAMSYKGWMIKTEFENMSHFELALQCFYLRLTDLRVLDSEEFENCFSTTVKQEINFRRDSMLSSKDQITESVTSLQWGDQSRLYLVSLQDLEKADIQKARLLLTSLLSYLEGGTLVVCGSRRVFDCEEAMPLIQGYMGGLAKSQISNPFSSIPWQEVSLDVEPVKEVRYLGDVPGRTHSFVFLPIPKPSDEIAKFYSSYFGNFAQNYFNDLMRFRYQETYSMSVSYISNPANLGIGYLQIVVTSATEQQEALMKLIAEEFQKFTDLHPEEIEKRLAFEKQLRQKSRAQTIKTTAYFYQALKVSILNGENVENIALYSEWEGLLSVKNVQEFLELLKAGWKLKKELVVHPNDQIAKV